MTNNVSNHYLLFLTSILLTGALSCTKRDRGADNKARTSEGRAIIQNKGSDTLVNVAQAWAEEYKKINPSIAIAVSGGGSGVGISALINGTVDLSNSSRKIKPKEQAMAEKRGHFPKEHIVGYDALAIFIHQNNPMKSITIESLKGIYGENGPIDKWSQLGIKIPGCSSDEIVRVSRQNNSGTYVYFKRAVLGKNADYKMGSRDMHGSKDVVDLVHNTPCAIGYSGLAYAIPGVKMPCISKDKVGACVAPSVETAIDKSYPIARPLFMYTDGEPKGIIKEYLDWILSDVGQCIILKKGYAPARKIACK